MRWSSLVRSSWFWIVTAVVVVTAVAVYVDTSRTAVDMGMSPGVTTNVAGTATNITGTFLPPISLAAATPAVTAGTCAHVDRSTGGDPLRNLMVAANFPWGCVPMFTDDQPFNNGDDQFGPVAHIAPLAAAFSNDPLLFNAAPLAAGVVVVDAQGPTPAPLPQTYQDLKLVEGVNCVYFGHTGQSAVAGWTAYVVPLAANATCTATPTPLHQLPVKVVVNTKFNQVGDVPPVGRFFEGKRGTLKNSPLFGLKCGMAWCFVLPATADTVDRVFSGQDPALRAWEVHGWNDSQHLSAWSASGSPQAQWDWKPAIVAAPGLETFTIANNFDQDWVFVATVFLKDDPPAGSKYDTKWHFKKGRNYLFLKHGGTIRDDGWTGVITYKQHWNTFDRLLKAVGVGNGHDLIVKRTDHSDLGYVAGTARFKWTDTDEDDWTRCDLGCCEIRGG